MAYEIKNLSLGTLKATTDYSAEQFFGVIASSSEGYFATAASTIYTAVLGILQNDPAINEAGEIWLPGCVSKAVAGTTTIRAGNNFLFLDGGRIGSTASAVNGSMIYGPVLEDPASTDDVITVAFNPIGLYTTS